MYTQCIFCCDNNLIHGRPLQECHATLIQKCRLQINENSLQQHNSKLPKSMTFNFTKIRISTAIRYNFTVIFYHGQELLQIQLKPVKCRPKICFPVIYGHSFGHPPVREGHIMKSIFNVLMYTNP